MVILSAVIASVVSEIGLGSEPAFTVPSYDLRSPSGTITNCPFLFVPPMHACIYGEKKALLDLDECRYCAYGPQYEVQPNYSYHKFSRPRSLSLT